MRIALVCDYSLDYLGGAQTAFLDQARVLAAAGHRVLVVAPQSRARNGGEWTRSVHANEGSATAFHRVRAHTDAGSAGDISLLEGGDASRPELPFARLWVPAAFVLPGVDLPWIRNTARLRARLRRTLLQRWEPDVVHVHSEFGLAAAAVQVARDAGVRTVQTVHTFFWQARVPELGVLQRAGTAGVRGLWRTLTGWRAPRHWTLIGVPPVDVALRAMTLGMSRHVDAVVSPSQHQAQALRTAQAGTQDQTQGDPVPADRGVHVVPNVYAGAASLEPIDAVRGPLRVVWVGRCVPEKRLLEFVRAVSLAVHRLGDQAEHLLRVCVVGDGPLLSRARRLAEADPVLAAVIEFSGRLSHNESVAAVRASHVVAITSLGFDNQPMTAVEAFANARGVLFVDPALAPEMGQGGMLAGAQPAQMADAIVELARASERVVALSAGAARQAQEFLPPAFLRRIESVYSS